MIRISTRDNVMNEETMEKFFQKRTKYHISLVQKYLEKIKNLDLDGVDPDILEEEKEHDSGKFEEPEHTPYLHINWKYKMKDEGMEYNPPKDIDTDEATFHHISTHKHHPDYWDENLKKEDAVNVRDRDKPTGKLVDATKMPSSYIASMMADWMAMSEEKGTSLRKWIEDNVNIRWKFSKDQVDLINTIAKKLRPTEYKND